MSDFEKFERIFELITQSPSVNIYPDEDNEWCISGLLNGDYHKYSVFFDKDGKFISVS